VAINAAVTTATHAYGRRKVKWKMMKKLLLASVALCGLAGSAWAGQCDAPPYGSRPNEYKAWIETFGLKVFVTTERANAHLQKVCEAKYLGNYEVLEPLHNLGIQDREIAAMSTVEISMRMMREIKSRM
jgi:hypothetical protein